MAEIIKFEKTEKGNDPADHVGDLGYEQRLRDSVLKPRNIPKWIEDFKMTSEELEAISREEGVKPSD